MYQSQVLYLVVFSDTNPLFGEKSEILKCLVIYTTHFAFFSKLSVEFKHIMIRVSYISKCTAGTQKEPAQNLPRDLVGLTIRR